jgi:hypothetical protein
MGADPYLELLGLLRSASEEGAAAAGGGPPVSEEIDGAKEPSSLFQ